MSHVTSKLSSSLDIIREVNLKQIFSSLYGERRVILGSLALFLLGGYLYLKLAEPIYTVDAMIQVEDQVRDASMAALDSVSALNARNPLNTEMELIRSRMILGRVVDELNLGIDVSPKKLPMIGSYYLRNIKKPRVVEWLRGYGYPAGEEFVTLTNLEVPNQQLGKAYTLRVLPNQRFEVRNASGELEVTGIPGQVAVGQHISVLVDSLRAKPGSVFHLARQPRLAAINRLSKQLALAEKSFSTGILEFKVNDPEPLRAISILNRITQVYVEQNRNRRQEDAKSALKFLDQQLPEVQETLQTSENKLSSFQEKSGSLNTGAEATMLMATLQSTQTTLDTEKFARESLLNRFTPNHPAVSTQDQKIATLQKQIAELKSRISRLPRIQEGATRLNRDLTIKNELYGNLVSVSQQLEIAKASRIGNLRTIDTAQQPLGPSWPQGFLVMLVSGMAGLFLGSFIAVLRLLLRNGIKDAEVLEQLTGVPVYAVIPHTDALLPDLRPGSRRTKQRGLLLEHAPDDIALESLRSLRTALRFAFLETASKRLLVTGPLPGIGKSFVAANLAGVMAQAGQRVLLVDADLRRGRLHARFGQPREQGLAELLAGDPLGMAHIKPTGLVGLSLLTTGALPPNPSELFLSSRLQPLLAELEEAFDLVIFDSAPVLPVTDTVMLANHIPVILGIAQFDQTTEREFRLFQSTLGQAGSFVRGVVLNNVTARFGAYGYGYNYNYAPSRKS